ncbi:right-handed parallel beta-helix repeat-containing protein [Paenibacillus eucommiae]|uniref:Right handed beta helix domain-containing protein n=1 Tax=Paenibacillus eucommiae TaxID=1355755 RepID=A0ABS4J2A3_9BACL|nr:right-handed parallel beta-helix repeat-containing protein [Paenibacillus eucommiae]MBP1993966.1 hypothetical protein [Paenibacillus eucommiae]
MPKQLGRQKKLKRFWLICIVLLLLLVVPGTSKDKRIQASLFVSPDGSGDACTWKLPCSLMAARDKAAGMNSSMTGDIVVNLRGGTYELEAAFTLTSQDSGTNAHSIIYQAFPGESPVISGGRTITGWTLHDSSADIYKAEVGTGFQTRQLYVNGARAVRARGEAVPQGFSKTFAGYTLPSTGVYAGMSNWSHIEDVEIVSYTNWRSYRCGVASITDLELTMKPLCWNNSQRMEEMGLPEWIENAYELLDSEGEWYLDSEAGELFYKPRGNESITDAEIIAPILETLISVEGTLENPVHDVQFVGLIFAYATWLRPGTEEGYIPLQAGFLYYGPSGGASDLDKEKTLSHVNFRAVRHIRLERNVFTHLGAAAVSFEYGSQNNLILGNRFEDISSHAIQLGHINDKDAAGAAIVSHNRVKDNYIADIGQEYQDAVGIFIGYTDGSVIDHNEITRVPYTAISLGWGWSDKPYASLRNNHITNNHIHDYMRVLKDGGGIYTLGRQDKSVISGNYIHDNHNEYGSIYLDQGSKGITISHNVVTNNYSNWIFTQDLPGALASGNKIMNNFTDTKQWRIHDKNTISGNQIMDKAGWSAAAINIMDHAGITIAPGL